MGRDDGYTNVITFLSLAFNIKIVTRIFIPLHRRFLSRFGLDFGMHMSSEQWVRPP